MGGSAGGGFGTGWGEQDPTAVGFFAGTGVYIGAKPEKGYYAEIGGFTYQGKGKTPGARLGLGINFTRYHIDAEKFFRGEYKYVMMTIIPVTHTRYYNPRGETIGWTISLFGKGIGLTWFEEGCVKGSSIALQ